MKRISRVLLIACRIISIVFFLLFWISVHRDTFVHYPSERGDPFFFKEQHSYWGFIQDYLVCKDKLYVLYGRKAVLECYSLKGEYLYSYSFYDESGGGAFLYIDQGNVILIGDNWDSYVFSPESGFLKYKKGDSSNWDLDKRKNPVFDTLSDVGDRYELHWASIYRISPDGSRERIIKRPFWMVVFQKSRCILIAFTFGCIIGIHDLITKGKERVKKEKAMMVEEELTENSNR